MNFIFAERSEQMANNKVYSRAEMQEAGIVTYDYAFMTEPGEYIGTLEMKAEARGGMLRLFLRLVDGRKIITPVFWWQGYLGLSMLRHNTDGHGGQSLKAWTSH